MNKIMQNDLILTRPLQVETWRIQGSIAKAQPRPDVLIVLQHLMDCGGLATVSSLEKTLFFEEIARKIVAERLLKITSSFGLTEKEEGKYSLTEKGKDALNRERIFIPEDGIWEITFSNDPLLPHQVIEIKPFKEPNIMEEALNKNDDKLKERQKKIKPISNWINRSNQEAVHPFLNKGETIIIEDIEKKGEKVDTTPHLKIEWNVNKQNIRLLSGKEIKAQFSLKDYTLNDVWQQMLEQNGWLDDWDWEQGSMAMHFDETTDIARKTMQGNVTFELPEIEDLGKFNDFIAKQIQFHAQSEQDAIDWAEWRLQDNISHFANRERYQQWCEHAKEPFQHYDFRLPERNHLAQMIWQKQPFTPKAWHLISAADWNL